MSQPEESPTHAADRLLRSVDAYLERAEQNRRPLSNTDNVVTSVAAAQASALAALAYEIRALRHAQERANELTEKAQRTPDEDSPKP